MNHLQIEMYLFMRIYRISRRKHPFSHFFRLRLQWVHVLKCLKNAYTHNNLYMRLIVLKNETLKNKDVSLLATEVGHDVKREIDLSCSRHDSFLRGGTW